MGKNGHISKACCSRDRGQKGVPSARRAIAHSQKWVQLEPGASGTEDSGDSDWSPSRCVGEWKVSNSGVGHWSTSVVCFQGCIEEDVSKHIAEKG